MLRQYRWFRAFAFAFVVLQLGLRMAAGVADAHLSADSERWEHFVHFESKGSTHIPPEHGVDCGLCSYLSASFTRANPVVFVVTERDRHAPVALRELSHLTAGAVELHRARAPPSV
jgi:hypothetical protein